MVRIILTLSTLLLFITSSYASKNNEKIYNSTYLEGIIGCDRLQNSNSLKCNSCGFHSKSSRLVLDNLLSKFDKNYFLNDIKIYDNGNKFLVFDNNKTNNNIKSDISFVYTHHMSLFDEERTLLNMQEGLKSITSGNEKSEKNINETTRKILVLVIDGPIATAEYVKNILNEAWSSLLDKQDLPTEDIMKRIVVHIVSVNSPLPITDISKETVNEILNDESLELKTLISLVAPISSKIMKSQSLLSFVAAGNDKGK